MKIKIKANELIKILIQKYDAGLLEKYGLNDEKIELLQDSMRKGKWRFVK